MKSDFKYVEEEMRLLGKQVNDVSHIAKELQTELNPRREELKKLSGTHQLLKRVRLRKYIVTNPNMFIFIDMFMYFFNIFPLIFLFIYHCYLAFFYVVSNIYRNRLNWVFQLPMKTPKLFPLYSRYVLTTPLPSSANPRPNQTLLKIWNL